MTAVWLSALLLVAGAAPASSGKEDVVIVKATADNPVDLHVEHGQYEVKTGPGFGLLVTGWVPNGLFAVYMVGPGGERVAVLAMEKNARVDSNGVASLMIPYGLRGVFPGNWAVLIVGDAGEHMIWIRIPVVEPPNAAHKAFRLTFPEPSGGANTGRPGATAPALSASH